jgi:3-hydroxybutyryl-CoA dehydrogenase
MTRVAVLGGGSAAAQIGCEFALGGCSVLWVAAERERCRQLVEEALRMASQHGLAGPPELERARALTDVREDGEEGRAAEGRLALVVEALPEELAGKAAAIAEIAARHPEVLVASTSGSISVTAIGEAAGVADRMVAIRYGSPPMLIPIVELLAARDTPPRLLDRISQLLRAIGKRPIVLEREVPGLIGGRLEMALLRECLWLVERGVASAETIDELVRDGLARAWRQAGPFETAALRGVDVFRELAEGFGEDPPEAVGIEELSELVPGDPAVLGTLRERRDEALATVLRAERARPSRPSEPPS